MEKTINYKKLSIHTLIIVAIILLAAISLQGGFAATTPIDNTTSGGISKALNDSVHGDIIELDEGKYTGNNNTNMTINKNITIQGKTKDKVILDAQGLSRIFVINNNFNVIFINLTFINGQHNNAGGGAIFINNASVRILNCNFINNSAVFAANNAAGAAIRYGGNGSLNIYDCIFSGSNATRAGDIYLEGYGDNSNIINCTFINSYADKQASAIESSVAGLNIINSTFIGENRFNTTTPALYIWGHNTSVINCNFINNTVSNGYGGAIFITNGVRNCIVINSTFINNSAVSGGAIHSNSIGLIIDNCTFINNSATFGGAVSIEGQNSSLENCDFYDNSAVNGAAINIVRWANNTTINNCTVTNNTSPNSAISIIGNNTILNNNNISDNLGSGIVNNASGTNIIDNVISNNTLNGVTNNGNVTLFDNIITGNSGDNVVNDGDLDGSGNTIDYRTDLIIISTNVSFNRVTVTVKASDQYGDIIVGATINFYVNGVLVGSAITNSEGIAEFAYNASNAGVQNILTYMPEFNGTNSLATTSINLAANNTTTTNVTNLATNSTIIVSNATNGKQTTVSGVLVDENGNPISGASLNVVIGGKSYSVVTGADGKWELLYTPSKAGNYNAKVYYNGDNLYLASTGSVAYTVAQEEFGIPQVPNIRLVKRNNSKAVRHGNVVYMKWLTFKNFGASGSQTINAKIIIKNLKYKLWKVYNKKLNYKFAKNNIKFKLNLKSNGAFKLKLKVYRPIR